MKASDLKPAGYNPRSITRNRLDALERSMRAFGDLSGIVFNRKTGRLVGGHQRVKNLQSSWPIFKQPAKDKTGTVAIGYVKTPNGSWSYREVNWNEEKEKAANIAANAHGGEFDKSLLAPILKDLNLAKFDLNLIGINFDQINRMVGVTSDLEGEPEYAHAPAVSKAGQVWALGKHRLMCGDAKSADNLKSLMDGKKADIAFTSPPYNVGKSAKLRGNKSIGGNLYGEGYDDDKESAAWYDLVKEAIACSLNHARYAFWNIQLLAGNREQLPRLWAEFAPHLVDVAIWNKKHGAPAMATNVMNSAFEFVFIFTSDAKPNRAIRVAPKFHGTIANVFEIPPQRDNKFSDIHAATFPIELPSTFIEHFCPKGGAVLDQFGGTGTTLMAAEMKGRACYTMEIDPKFCDVVITRWEKFTGKKATLV